MTTPEALCAAPRPVPTPGAPGRCLDPSPWRVGRPSAPPPPRPPSRGAAAAAFDLAALTLWDEGLHRLGSSS